MNVYTKRLGAAERGVSSELAAFLNYLQETTDYQLGQLSAGLEARGEDGAAQQASLEALSTALEVERQALAALTERVSTMETAMAALTKRVSTTESGIEDLEDRVRDLEWA